MAGKYVYSRNYEAKAFRTRIEIHEGDRYAPAPGAYYGYIILLDDNDNVVERRPLGPEELHPLVAHLTGAKNAAIESSGAVFVEDPREIEDVEVELEDLKETP